MTKDRDCRGVPAGAASGGDGGVTPPKKDQLRMIDSDSGPHPPFWWVISGDDEELCYLNMENVWNAARGTHQWVATAWNVDGFRAVYGQDTWKTARLEGLAQPVRPDTEIQRVIIRSVDREVITPRAGLELYEETLQKDRVEELTGLLRRAEEVMRAWGIRGEHRMLMDDIQEALIEAKREDRPHSVADAAEDGSS